MQATSFTVNLTVDSHTHSQFWSHIYLHAILPQCSGLLMLYPVSQECCSSMWPCLSPHHQCPSDTGPTAPTQHTSKSSWSEKTCNETHLKNKKGNIHRQYETWGRSKKKWDSVPVCSYLPTRLHTVYSVTHYKDSMSIKPFSSLV